MDVHERVFNAIEARPHDWVLSSWANDVTYCRVCCRTRYCVEGMVGPAEEFCPGPPTRDLKTGAWL